MPLPPGTRLGPYEVLALIGQGGMGDVYRARDPRLNRPVALKVLRNGPGAAETRRTLLEEARAASALNHPHIVTVYDLGSEDGIDYIAMELIEGESLADALARGPVGVKQVVAWGSQIAEALAGAHA